MGVINVRGFTLMWWNPHVELCTWLASCMDDPNLNNVVLCLSSSFLSLSFSSCIFLCHHYLPSFVGPHGKHSPSTPWPSEQKQATQTNLTWPKLVHLLLCRLHHHFFISISWLKPTIFYPVPLSQSCILLRKKHHAAVNIHQSLIHSLRKVS